MTCRTSIGCGGGYTYSTCSSALGCRGATIMTCGSGNFCDVGGSTLMTCSFGIFCGGSTITTCTPGLGCGGGLTTFVTCGSMMGCGGTLKTCGIFGCNTEPKPKEENTEKTCFGLYGSCGIQITQNTCSGYLGIGSCNNEILTRWTCNCYQATDDTCPPICIYRQKVESNYSQPPAY